MLHKLTKYGPYACAGILILLLFIISIVLKTDNNFNTTDYPQYVNPENNRKRNHKHFDDLINQRNDPIINQRNDSIINQTNDNNVSQKNERREYITESSENYNEESLVPIITPICVKNKIKKKKQPSKGEFLCKQTLERYYGRRFENVRPDWLKNPVTNSNLELDGFNANIPTKLGKGLAFEYDGVQHAEYNKHFHRKGPEEFVYQTKKDSWKDKRCKEMGILLIRIPHFIVFHDLERYIKQKLDKEGVRVGTSRNFYD